VVVSADDQGFDVITFLWGDWVPVGKVDIVYYGVKVNDVFVGAVMHRKSKSSRPHPVETCSCELCVSLARSPVHECTIGLTHVSNSQIIEYSEEMAELGNDSDVELCQRALDGHKQSREEVVRLIDQHLYDTIVRINQRARKTT